MDKTQHQITEFHEILKPVLSNVLEEHNKNPISKVYDTIVKPCKQLIQKCSCKSASDMRSLRSLTYWLYIFGYKELALEICELALNTDFSFEYEVDGIADMYGLEIRIARELFNENRSRSIPTNLIDFYFSKKIKRELVYPKILREYEIASSNGRFTETEMLRALYNMIGKRETGLFSHLNEYGDEIEKSIADYISYLRED